MLSTGITADLNDYPPPPRRGAFYKFITMMRRECKSSKRLCKVSAIPIAVIYFYWMANLPVILASIGHRKSLLSNIHVLREA